MSTPKDGPEVVFPPVPLVGTNQRLASQVANAGRDRTSSVVNTDKRAGGGMSGSNRLSDTLARIYSRIQEKCVDRAKKPRYSRANTARHKLDFSRYRSRLAIVKVVKRFNKAKT